MEDYRYITIITLAAIIAIIIGLTKSRSFRAKLSKKGLEVDKDDSKNEVKITKVKNKSEIKAKTKNEQNLTIDEIDNSKIEID
jgi:hypothetical protein